MKIVALLLMIAMPLSASSLSDATRLTPPEFGEAKQPQIAIGNEGEIHVVFGKGDAVYMVSSDDAGAFSEPVKVGELRRLALGMRRGPRVATAEDAVVVTAISHEDGNLYSWRSDDRSRSWSKPVLVNTVSKSAVEGLHALASDGKASVAVVWLDLRNGKTELWASVSTDGGRSWPGNALVYRSPDRTICECCHPSVIFTPTGRLVVMWRNWLNGSRDMYRAESSDHGKTFSGATKIGTGTWKLQACPMDGGSLTVDGERIAYAWRREQKLFATTDPGSETVLSDSGTQPVAVRTQDGFGYLWQDQGNLYWKPAADQAPVLFAQGGGYAASAWNPAEQNTIVVWEGSDGVYAETVR